MNTSKTTSINDQAQYLERHAHCLGVNIIAGGMKKFFIYDHFYYNDNTKKYETKSSGFVVFYRKINKDYEPMQVIKYPPKEIQLMVDCIGLHYGE